MTKRTGGSILVLLVLGYVVLRAIGEAREAIPSVTKAKRAAKRKAREKLQQAYDWRMSHPDMRAMQRLYDAWQERGTDEGRVLH